MKNVMKYTLLAALILLLFTGCDLFQKISTQSIKQCMNGFIAAAESENFGACANYIHPDSNISNASSNYFSGLYSGASFGSPSYSGSSATVSITYPVAGTFNEVFDFRQDSDDNWLIYDLTIYAE